MAEKGIGISLAISMEPEKITALYECESIQKLWLSITEESMWRVIHSVPKDAERANQEVIDGLKATIVANAIQRMLSSSDLLEQYVLEELQRYKDGMENLTPQEFVQIKKNLLETVEFKRIMRELFGI